MVNSKFILVLANPFGKRGFWATLLFTLPWNLTEGSWRTMFLQKDPSGEFHVSGQADIPFGFGTQKTRGVGLRGNQKGIRSHIRGGPHVDICPCPFVEDLENHRPCQDKPFISLWWGHDWGTEGLGRSPRAKQPVCTVPGRIWNLASRASCAKGGLPKEPTGRDKNRPLWSSAGKANVFFCHWSRRVFLFFLFFLFCPSLFLNNTKYR